MYYTEVKKKYSEKTLELLDEFLVGKSVDVDENNFENKTDIFIPENLLTLFELKYREEIPLEEKLFPPRHL